MKNPLSKMKISLCLLVMVLIVLIIVFVSEGIIKHYRMESIAGAIAALEPEALRSCTVEVYSYDSKRDLYLSVVSFADEGWADQLVLICFHHGKVQWQKEIIPGDPATVRGIFKLKVLTLQGFKEPLFQLYDRTHMGNGFFYIYQIVNNHPVQLLSTFAVDCNWEQLSLPDEDSSYAENNKISSLIRGEFLAFKYTDLNKDGIADLALEGNIDYYTGPLSENDQVKKHPLAGTGTWKKVFLFDKKKCRFCPDKQASFYKSHFKYRAYYLEDLD